MKKILSILPLCAALLAFGGGDVSAQERGIGAPPTPDRQAHLIALSQSKLKEGEESFARADFDHARSSFDAALDVFLNSGYDLRSDSQLMAAYREAVARVHRYQLLAANADGENVWPQQAYEATSDDFRVEDLPSEGDLVAANGDLSNATFLVRLAELQRRFKEKFGREFILTGRDTSVHTRLYGHGRATDVRVRDLTAPQVQYIVRNARELNMRVLDFSSSESVYRHNLRVIALGRSLDTMATGVHLHLNDLPRTAGRHAAQPASKKKTTSAAEK